MAGSHVAWLLLGIEVAAVVFTGCAVANSLYLIRMHMRWNRHPLLLTCTVRILLMVPIYSVVSCVGLWVRGTPFEVELCEVVRVVYEAVIIFSFLQFIVASAGGAEHLVARFRVRATTCSACTEAASALEAGKAIDVEGVEPVKHAHTCGTCMCSTKGSRQAQHFPLLNRCLPPWESAGQMLRWCVRGSLLYVVVGAMYAAAHILILSMHIAGHRDFLGRKTIGSIFKVALIVAQALGMTCLVTLAVNMLEDLEHLRPRAKFLSVKLVVAFCFWQQLILLALRSAGVFRPLIDVEHRWDTQQEISQSLQHLLICAEMFAASVYHARVFPPHDYLNILAHLHAAEEHVDLAPLPRCPGVAVVSLGDVVETVRSVKKNVLCGGGGDPVIEATPRTPVELNPVQDVALEEGEGVDCNLQLADDAGDTKLRL